MTELDLIKLAQSGDRKATNKLCKMHTGFIKVVASKYAIKGYEYDDVVQLCFDGLIKAIEDYRLDSGFKLISYAVYKIRGFVSRKAGELKKQKRDGCVCSLDAHFYTDDGEVLTSQTLLGAIRVDHEFYSGDCFEMLEKCIEKSDLSEQKKKVLRHKFNSIKHGLDYTLTDIGDKVGLTRERVRQILKGVQSDYHFKILYKQLKEMAEAQ